MPSGSQSQLCLSSRRYASLTSSHSAVGQMNPNPQLLRLHNPPEKQKRLTAMKKFVFDEQLPPTCVLIKTSDVGTDLQFASKMLTFQLQPRKRFKTFCVRPAVWRALLGREKLPDSTAIWAAHPPITCLHAAYSHHNTSRTFSKSSLEMFIIPTALFPALSFCLLHGGCERTEISFMSYVQHVCHV